MTSRSGVVPTLNIPPVPDNTEIPPEIADYLSRVIFSVVEYAELVSAKLEDLESISRNGQGLNLTVWPANASIEKRDGVCCLFDGDPNVGTPGAGVQGWYAWSQVGSTWAKM